MKKWILAFAVVLFVSVPVVHADTTSQRAIIEEILQVTKADQMMKPIYAQMRSLMEKQFVQMGASEDLQPILKKYINKIFDVTEQSLSWQVLKNDMIAIYAQTFTEGELRGMLAFYKSPVGQSVIDKLPAVAQQSMAIVQKHMPEMQPKLLKVSEEFAEELKTAMAEKKGKAERKPEKGI